MSHRRCLKGVDLLSKSLSRSNADDGKCFTTHEQIKSILRYANMIKQICKHYAQTIGQSHYCPTLIKSLKRKVIIDL